MVAGRSNRYEMSNALVRLMWKWHLSSHDRNPTRRWCGCGRLIRKHPNRSSVRPSKRTSVFRPCAKKRERIPPSPLDVCLKSINCAVAPRGGPGYLVSNRQMSKHGTVHARGEMLGREDTASGDGEDGIGIDDSSLNRSRES